MAKRIDSLVPGDEVILRFHRGINDPYRLRVIFTGISGEGEDRRAKFQEDSNDTEGFEIYRYNGRWAAASDARKVSMADEL